MTFNQSSYIIDTMNGFCSQETSFPFVCTIIDDASTDGEQETILNYVQKNFISNKGDFYRFEETEEYIRICSRHKKNVNCYFVVILLKYNHYSIRKSKRPYFEEWIDVKYIAFCEGDDYWIDPIKLQEQVDFLDNHEDVIMCCGGYKIFVGGTPERDVVFKRNNCSGYTFTLEDNLESWHTKTLTSMIRAKDADDYKKNYLKYKYARDTHLYYHLLAKGDGYYFSKIMGVYNVHPGGTFSMANSKKNAFIAANSYRELYEVNNHDKRLKKVLFKWICIVIVDCYLPIKDVLKEVGYAQKLVQSVGMEIQLIKSTIIWIYRKLRYGTKRV